MPTSDSGILAAHPAPRHPRIATRIREITFAADKNLAVIRAPRRQDQDGQHDDLNACDNGSSHFVVLVENYKCVYRNSKQIQKSKSPKLPKSCPFPAF